jgi:hypothetical protein
MSPQASLARRVHFEVAMKSILIHGGGVSLLTGQKFILTWWIPRPNARGNTPHPPRRQPGRVFLKSTAKYGLKNSNL